MKQSINNSLNFYKDENINKKYYTKTYYNINPNPNINPQENNKQNIQNQITNIIKLKHLFNFKKY